MDLTLKQSLDMVAGSVGMLPPTSWANSNNQANRQMIHIANETVLALREKKFQTQRKQWAFTLTADSTRYTPPSDYLQFEPDTMWAQSSLWRVTLPTDPTVWAYLQASAGPSGVQIQARYLNNAVEVYQPIGDLPMGVEYLSKYCVVTAWTGGVLTSLDAGTQSLGGSLGSYKALFTDDSDTHLFDDALFVAEVKWRYKKAKGFDDWPVDKKDADDKLITVLGRDGGARIITAAEDQGIFCGPQTTLWVYPFS